MSVVVTLPALREVHTEVRRPGVAAAPARGSRSILRALRGASRVEALDGTLATAPVGSTAVVVEVAGDLEPAAVRRLIHLGFAPGATVQVLRRAPLGDPTVFRVADTEIALRRRHASVIRVDVLS